LIEFRRSARRRHRRGAAETERFIAKFLDAMERLARA
jgi:hypothetical protein